MGDSGEVRGGVAELGDTVASQDSRPAITASLELVTDQARHPYTVVHLKGELDLYTAPLLAQQLAELARNGTSQVVVDLEAIDFLDSTGLRVLIEAQQRLQKLNGTLRVVCTRSMILTAFRITGLDHALSVHATVDEAAPLAYPSVPY